MEILLQRPKQKKYFLLDIFATLRKIFNDKVT